MKRWLVVIDYNDGSLERYYDIEELEELQEIIERGPPFETIREIRVKYQHGMDRNVSR